MSGRDEPPLIREARPEDAPALARVQVDTWRTTYRGIIPDEHLAGLSYERREERWREILSDPAGINYVAETGSGEVVGLASGGPERDGDPLYRGEVYALYLLEPHQGRGIGRELFRVLAEHLRQEGLTGVLVWALADNPFCAFYERLRGTRVREKNVTIGGRPLVEVAYGWPVGPFPQEEAT